LDGFRPVESWRLRTGDEVHVQTDQFYVRLFAGAVRGGAMRLNVSRDPSPGGIGIPLELLDAELGINNPHEPLLVAGSLLVAFTRMGDRDLTLSAGQIDTIFVRDEAA
jgi:hypothetical protein